MPLSLPSDLCLSFFAYGLLKPGQLAHRQISELIAEKQEGCISAHLLILDGIPLASEDGGGVEGCVLRFKQGQSPNAYKKICKFEPESYYKWGDLELENSGERVNVLLAKKKSRDGAEALYQRSWSGDDDPVFVHGLLEIQTVVEDYAQTEFFGPLSREEWRRFFRLQMAYLLLWSALERYTTLSFGVNPKPGKRVERLAREREFGEALKRHVKRKDSVTDSRNPSTSYDLNADDPVTSGNYYYQIRCNLSHRGKGAYREAEKVRCSLVELAAVFADLIEAAFPSKGDRAS